MKGIWMTESSLYPGSYQIPAMLISKAPEHDKLIATLKKEKYIAQPKKDGAWYQLEKTKDGNVYLFSRSKSKKTGELSEKIDHVPHIKEWADQIPNGTILIGEIYYPGGKSNDVTKIMGSLAEKAIERQKGEYGLIHYYIHDIIMYDGKSYLETPFDRRYSSLCNHIDLELYNPDFIEIANSKTGFDIYKAVKRWIASGEEGGVFKLQSGLYVPGKRPTYNFKLKEEVNDIDLVITDVLDPEEIYTGKELESWPYWEEISEYDNNGKAHATFWSVEDATGEYGAYYQHKHNPQWYKPVTKAYYYGWKNAFKLGAYNSFGDLVDIGRVASGITDEMKQDMANNPNKYIGSVCEIQAMSLDKENYTLRHPRFIRLRPDKNAEDCKLFEIFN